MEEITILKEKPKGFPEVIYKFRDWKNEKHRRLILQNELYLPSPKDFNDPFDCRIPEDFTSLNSVEKIEAYAENSVQRHSPMLQMMGIDLDAKKSEIIERLNGKPKEIQLENEQWLFAEQDARYGIISFSCIWNNLLLWSHYAANHTGFCVGFDEEMLRSLPKFQMGGEISYRKDFPVITPMLTLNNEKREILSRAISEAFTKADDWRYEKEYRLLKLFYPNIPTNENRIITVPDGFFKEVILGLTFPVNDVHSMIEIANQKEIPIYQAQKIPFKFRLTRVQLN